MSTQEQPAVRDNDARIVDYLNGRLSDLAENRNFSGVVLFARDENVLFHRACGLANRSYNVKNNIDTRFNMASSSKMFTAVAIAKLVEERRLSYDDLVGRYLDSDWVSPGVGSKVQIKHLLNHTSGLGLYWDKWQYYSNTVRKLDDYKQVISDELAFEPGTDSGYSNTGYILLGAVIEKITGKTFFEYIQEAVFDPCGMTATGFYEMDIPYPNIATGYYEDKEDGGKLKNNTFIFGVRGSAPDGGVWSTSMDVYRFILCLRSDVLVRAGTREILWTVKPLFPNYGYGFQIEDDWIGHWGGFDGFESFVFYFPRSGHTFIVFSNYWDSALPLIDDMTKRWLNKLDQE